ncbi:MAG: DUF2905 domain-containing protein [Firmicutes bacterium]|jgi:hypothetical protein|nr:DUF2905 domain-containing protein [Bacillota bacterium]
MGRTLVMLGFVLILVGIALNLAPRIPWLGRLPGDIVIKKEGFVLYFPLATCLLASLVLSLLMRIFRR